jgi:hypothetical protein
MTTVDVLVTGYVEQTDAAGSSGHPTVSLTRAWWFADVVVPGHGPAFRPAYNAAGGGDTA